jgi:cytochrome c oxidase cbb3-type subunit 1
MSTFEGPVMAAKTVNALSHYTDWTVGHVHSGALGWVGFITFGSFYYLIPRLWKREEMYSLKLVSVHLWTASLGIVFYISAMWVSGIMQGLMWRSYNELGFLNYSFVETVVAMHPFYVIRAMGGALYLTGFLVMIYNIFRTIKGDVAANEVDKDGNPREAKIVEHKPAWQAAE